MTNVENSMWHAFAIVANSFIDDLPRKPPIPLSKSVRLDVVPNWVKEAEALNRFSLSDKKRIERADLAFICDYEADALGSIDPDWRGSQPRPIQASVNEKFLFAALSLWLVKPSNFVAGPLLHFSGEGEDASLRNSSSPECILISEDDTKNVLNNDDLLLASELLESLLSIERRGAVWVAIRTLFRATTEKIWEIRYLLHWVVLEAIFGSKNSSEITYRISQRIAFHLGCTAEDRIKIFTDVKKAYGWRSKIAHEGRDLSKLNSNISLELSSFLENIVRQGLTKILVSSEYLEIFNGGGRDKYLDKIVFI